MRESQFARNHSIFELMARAGHNFSDLAPAFPSKTLEEIEEIFQDNRLSLRRTYERFGYLGIRECSSRNFNIKSNGARSNGGLRTSSVDSHIVHCYGGSTTVGDGVSDNHTISAYLESELNAKSETNISVLNYGGGNHTSLHSTLRLLDHCFAGNVPDQAVFLNGFNDCFYSSGGADGVVPFFDEVLRLSQDSELSSTALSEIVDLIPNSSKESLVITDTDFSSELIEKCLENIKLRYASAAAIHNFVENSFGVKIFRFIEPSQAINCRFDQKLLPRVSELNPRVQLVGSLYKEIYRLGEVNVFGKNVISMISIDQDRKKFPLFLDGVHFSPAMNEWIAIGISYSMALKQKSWIRKNFETESRSATSNELLNPNNYPLF